jgi:hypothetical protein
MKLSHFLRFYQNLKGLPLSREEAELEAAKLGISIDRSGELDKRAEASLKSESFAKEVA